MLGIMRKYQQSFLIKGVFFIIVLSFVGTIFLVWGKGDGGRGGSAAYAAKVNGRKISLEAYQQAYTNLRRLYQQIYGPALTPDMEKQIGLRKQALDRLVEKELLLDYAKKNGIKATDEEVRQSIAAVPAFQKNGVFDFQQYQQMLKGARMTPGDFEEGQKEEIILKKARQKIVDQTKLTDDDLLKEFHKRNDKVTLRYIAFSPAEVKKEVKLTDAELEAYLQKNQQQFRTPEEVSISYVRIDPASYAGKVTLTEDELNAWYQKNVDRYAGKGGILPYTEVKDRVKVDAVRNRAAKLAYEAAADALIKSGKSGDLAAVAAQLGAKPTETASFTAKAPPATLVGEQEVINKAFLLKQGEIGGPVETARGVYILKLKEKKASVIPPLAKIRPQVEAAASAEKAVELAKKKAEDATAKMAKGETVAGQETALFAFADKAVPGIGTAPELMESAFGLTASAPVAKAPVKVGDRWYAFRLKERQEAKKEAFEHEKERLKQAILPTKQEEAYATWVKDARQKAKVEENKTLLAE